MHPLWALCVLSIRPVHARVALAALTGETAHSRACWAVPQTCAPTQCVPRCGPVQLAETPEEPAAAAAAAASPQAELQLTAQLCKQLAAGETVPNVQARM